MVSRRQRAKGEGTFLETVKSLLTDLHFEVQEIKQLVLGSKLPSGDVTFPLPLQHTYWGLHGEMTQDWQTWTALGFEDDPITRSHCNHQPTWDVDAPSFEPCAALQRDVLLSYRLLAEAPPPPEELSKCTSCANQCLGAQCDDEEGIAQYMNWTPTRCNVFQHHSTLMHELQVDAAVLIQRWLRSRAASNGPIMSDDSTSGESELELEQVQSGWEETALQALHCRGLLSRRRGYETGYAGVCSDCRELVAASLLQPAANGGLVCISCDPGPVGQHDANPEAVLDELPEDHLQDAKAAAVEETQQIADRATYEHHIEQRLEQMVRFVESADAGQTSLAMTPEMRSDILEISTATLCWKRKPRTSKEFQSRISMIDDAMTTVMERLQRQS